MGRLQYILAESSIYSFRVASCSFSSWRSQKFLKEHFKMFLPCYSFGLKGEPPVWNAYIVALYSYKRLL